MSDAGEVLEERPLRWDGQVVVAIDQTLLPHREVWRRLETPVRLAEAIRSLRIRGAPALGIAGSMGVALAAARSRARTVDGVLADTERAGAMLAETRPTAVNLAWGVRRALGAARAALADGADRDGIAKAVRAEAEAIAAEDAAACDAIARSGLALVPEGARILTHCNTGFLCTGGGGTALGIIRLAHLSGRGIHVLATETRPLLQGARLTTWELARLGVPHALVLDGAAPALIARGEVDLVVVGADRIAACGDVANKIGTYALALAAADSGIPFVVAAPMSSVDLRIPTGRDIPVEHRDPAEVVSIFGKRIAPAGTDAINPAFDITPARLVTAIVTERGVARPPYTTSLSEGEVL